jgi:hypothetical protein
MSWSGPRVMDRVYERVGRNVRFTRHMLEDWLAEQAQLEKAGCGPPLVNPLKAWSALWDVRRTRGRPQSGASRELRGRQTARCIWL